MMNDSKQTLVQAIREWLRTYPPLAEGRLGVDYLPEDAQTYSIDSVPSPETVKRYLDGSAVKQFDFILASRVFWGDQITGNTENLAFYEAFSNWVEAQSRRPKHLPALDGGRMAQKVEVTTLGYPYQVSEDGRARYQIQLKLTYFAKGSR